MRHFRVCACAFLCLASSSLAHAGSYLTTGKGSATSLSGQELACRIAEQSARSDLSCDREGPRGESAHLVAADPKCRSQRTPGIRKGDVLEFQCAVVCEASCKYFDTLDPSRERQQ
jgi:hypothetical protein